MKKKIAIAVIFVCGILVFFVPYFFSNSWRNVELKREVIQSAIYELKDVEHAMTLVEHTFSQELQECKMTRISYDESAYRQFADGFKKQKSDEVMVIYTDFITVSNVPCGGSYAGAQCGVYCVSVGIAVLIRSEGVDYHRFGIWFFIYLRCIER